MNKIELIHLMILIRKVEELLEKLFQEGKLSGTMHSCIGQEASAVGCIVPLDKNDVITSNHRCHGHYLAYSKNPYKLIAEIMGRYTGINAGRGGSQHIQENNFYTNGITGGMAADAVGMAFAEKIKESGNIVVAFLGDGALGQGVVYETMNMASLWKVPLIYIVENNLYAMSTSIRDNLAGNIESRAKAFGIKYECYDGQNVFSLYEKMKHIYNRTRNEITPILVEVLTYRFHGHSKSDDCCYRTQQEEDKWKQSDPIAIAKKEISDDDYNKINDTINTDLQEIVRQIENDPYESEASLNKYLFNNNS